MINAAMTLTNKSFFLNSYPGEGSFWERIVMREKEAIAKLFGVDTPEDPDGDLILQCDDKFSNCIVYYDGVVKEYDTTTFLNIVQKLQI